MEKIFYLCVTLTHRVFHFFPNWSNTVVAQRRPAQLEGFFSQRSFFVCLFAFCLSAVPSHLPGRNQLVSSLIVKSASRQLARTHSKKVAGSIPGPGALLCGVSESPPPWTVCVLSRFSFFLPQSRKLHVRRMGISKLFVCRSECVTGFVCRRSVSMSGTCPGCVNPRLHPKTAGSSPATLRDPGSRRHSYRKWTAGTSEPRGKTNGALSY